MVRDKELMPVRAASCMKPAHKVRVTKTSQDRYTLTSVLPSYLLWEEVLSVGKNSKTFS